MQGALPSDMSLLRRRVQEMEEMQDEARTAVEKLSEAVDKLRAPALRLGTLLSKLAKGRALVCVGGTDYVCSVDPSLPEVQLETGTRVLLNEAFAVTDSFGFDKNGPVVRISECLSDGRLRVGNETGISDAVVVRSSLLAKEKLKPGVDLRLDTNQRVAVEIIGVSKRLDRSLARVEAIPWNNIGGQQEAVQAIRDSIELPFLHAHLFKRFNHPVPKGFLLYGPPGCGKTLLGKATAHNLRLQIKAETGEDHPESVVFNFVRLEFRHGRGLEFHEDSRQACVERPSPSQAVDGLEPAGRHQPRARVRRFAFRGPPLQRGNKRILQCLLGEIEIAEEADQRGKNAT
jgi:proteasome-associated ATPase